MGGAEKRGGWERTERKERNMGAYKCRERGWLTRREGSGEAVKEPIGQIRIQQEERGEKMGR